MGNRNRNKPAESRDFYQVLKQSVPDQTKVITNRPDGQTVAATIPVKVRKAVVAWGFPLDEVLFSKWFVNYLSLPVMPWDVNLTAQSTYLPDARNIIHRNFLNGCGAEWLVMLDSDVLPPPDFLEKLLAHHLPMVGGWYRKKGHGNPPVVYDYQGLGEDDKMQWRARQAPGTGLEQVDGAGAGCWLMRRDVAQAIGEEPYDLIHGGEDLSLCLKVRAAGFPIYIDWNIACAHAGVMYV
jgi:hypothetical protein